MPLGQQPYGTRPTPTPDDGDGPKPQNPWDRRLGFTWLLWIPVVAVVAYFAAGRDKSSKPPEDPAAAGPSECLTHKSCAADWRCFAVPKDDPFAVSGVCAQLCEGDLQCPAQHRCEEVAVGKQQLVPVGARGATDGRMKICQSCERGCDPK